MFTSVKLFLRHQDGLGPIKWSHRSLLPIPDVKALLLLSSGDNDLGKQSITFDFKVKMFESIARQEQCEHGYVMFTLKY